MRRFHYFWKFYMSISSILLPGAITLLFSPFPQWGTPLNWRKATSVCVCMTAWLCEGNYLLLGHAASRGGCCARLSLGRCDNDDPYVSSLYAIGRPSWPFLCQAYATFAIHFYWIHLEQMRTLNQSTGFQCYPVAHVPSLSKVRTMWFNLNHERSHCFTIAPCFLGSLHREQLGNWSLWRTE